MQNISNTNTPMVVIVGRINVGKSTLFNRLIGRQKAITSPLAGTTRDVNYGDCFWRGKKIVLVDTGGLDPVHPDDIEQKTLERAKQAAQEASVIIFVADGKTGILSHDREIAKVLRLYKKPVVVAINKTERSATRFEAGAFAALGFTDMIAVSALTGAGTGDLLDLVLEHLPSLADDSDKTIPLVEPEFRIGFFGRPNVGKSSLMNVVLGKEEAIVSQQPHTTRDVKIIAFNWQGRELALVDTAGLRRHAPKARGLLFKRRLSRIFNQRELESIERDAVKRTMAVLRYVDVSCLLLPADEPISSQDLRLASVLAECGRAVVLVITKWDSVPEKNRADLFEMLNRLPEKFPLLKWALVIVTSAKNNFGLDCLLTACQISFSNWSSKIPDETLRTVLKNTFNILPKQKTAVDSRNVKMYRLKQIGSQPPRFTLEMHRKSVPPAALLPILEKQMRLLIDLRGTPIRIEIRK